MLRRRLTALRLDKIAAVDRPAQIGAIATIIKSASNPADVPIRKNAEAVVTGASVAYSAADFEGAMLRLADEIAAERGITPERALLAALATDSAMMNLAHAASVARAVEYGAAVRKRFGSAA